MLEGFHSQSEDAGGLSQTVRSSTIPAWFQGIIMKVVVVCHQGKSAWYCPIEVRWLSALSNADAIGCLFLPDFDDSSESNMLADLAHVS